MAIDAFKTKMPLHPAAYARAFRDRLDIRGIMLQRVKSSKQMTLRFRLYPLANDAAFSARRRPLFRSTASPTSSETESRTPGDF